MLYNATSLGNYMIACMIIILSAVATHDKTEWLMNDWCIFGDVA